MRDYDALPPDLRRWIAGAVLPWSPASCLALWRRALEETGSIAAACDRLDRAERAALDRAAAE